MCPPDPQPRETVEPARMKHTTDKAKIFFDTRRLVLVSIEPPLCAARRYQTWTPVKVEIDRPARKQEAFSRSSKRLLLYRQGALSISHSTLARNNPGFKRQSCLGRCPFKRRKVNERPDDKKIRGSLVWFDIGLLSQKDVSTTMIYTRALNRGGRGIKSPADLL